MKKESSLMILAVMLTFQSTASVRGYIPIGGWDEAHATYYGGNDASGTNNGACGYGNQLSAGYGTITTALSTPLFEQGKTCGACYELRCFGGEAEGCLYGSPPVIVTATNFCPPGSFGGWCDPPNVHFDLSEPAFSHLARVPVGHVRVGYTRVNCERSGGMRFTINGHTYFNQVLVTNVGGAGDVEQVWIRGSNSGSMPMVRNWGQNWLNEGDMDGQKLSFLVTTSDGRTATSYDVAPPNWQFGQTFSGTQVLSH